MVACFQMVWMPCIFFNSITAHIFYKAQDWPWIVFYYLFTVDFNIKILNKAHWECNAEHVLLELTTNTFWSWNQEGKKIQYHEICFIPQRNVFIGLSFMLQECDTGGSNCICWSPAQEHSVYTNCTSRTGTPVLANRSRCMWVTFLPSLNIKKDKKNSQ